MTPKQKRSPPLGDLRKIVWLRRPIDDFVARGIPVHTTPDARDPSKLSFDWDLWVPSQLRLDLWLPGVNSPNPIWCKIVADWKAARPPKALVVPDDQLRDSLTNAIVKLIVAGFIARAYKAPNNDPMKLDIDRRKHINTVYSRLKGQAEAPSKVKFIDVLNLALALSDFEELHRNSRAYSPKIVLNTHPIPIVRERLRQICKLGSNVTVVRESPEKLLIAVRDFIGYLRNQVSLVHWIPWYVVLPINPAISESYERVARDFCNGLPSLDMSWSTESKDALSEPQTGILSNWMVLLLDSAHVRRWSVLAHFVNKARRKSKLTVSDMSYVVVKVLLISAAEQCGKLEAPNMRKKIEAVANSQKISSHTGISFYDMVKLAMNIVSAKKLVTTTVQLSNCYPTGRRYIAVNQVSNDVRSGILRVLSCLNSSSNSSVLDKIGGPLNLLRLGMEYAHSAPKTLESIEYQQKLIGLFFNQPVLEKCVLPNLEQNHLCRLIGTASLSTAVSTNRKRCARDAATDNDQRTRRRRTIETNEMSSSPPRILSIFPNAVNKLHSLPQRDGSQSCANNEFSTLIDSVLVDSVMADVSLFPNQMSRHWDWGVLSGGAIFGDYDFGYRRVKHFPSRLLKLIEAVRRGHLNAANQMLGIISNTGLAPLPRNWLDHVLRTLKRVAVRCVQPAIMLAQLLHRGAPGIEPLPEEAKGVYEFMLKDMTADNTQRGIVHSNLGAIHLYSNRRPMSTLCPDTAKAILHFQIAYACGNEFALTNLGNLYQSLRDFGMAAMYYLEHFAAKYDHGITYFSVSQASGINGCMRKRTDYALRLTNKRMKQKFLHFLLSSKVEKCVGCAEEVVVNHHFVDGVNDYQCDDVLGDWGLPLSAPVPVYDPMSCVPVPR